MYLFGLFIFTSLWIPSLSQTDYLLLNVNDCNGQGSFVMKFPVGTSLAGQNWKNQGSIRPQDTKSNCVAMDSSYAHWGNYKAVLFDFENYGDFGIWQCGDTSCNNCVSAVGLSWNQCNSEMNNYFGGAGTSHSGGWGTTDGVWKWLDDNYDLGNIGAMSSFSGPQFNWKALDGTIGTENIDDWTEPTAECYGADIYENFAATTLDDCRRGCEAYAGCTFITFGKSDSHVRCIYKNGQTSIYTCVGCNADGTCGTSASCDTRWEYCSTNILTNTDSDPTQSPSQSPTQTPTQSPSPSAGCAAQEDKWNPGWGENPTERCTDWWDNAVWGADQQCSKCGDDDNFGYVECARTCCEQQCGSQNSEPTLSPSSTPTQSPSPSGIDCNDITIQDLDGKQFSAEYDRYRYTIEVGPGGTLYQTETYGDQDTYYLGAHTGYSGEYAEIFGSGDYCDGIGDDRTAKITYTFGGSVTELLSITEPSMCYYELEIRVGSDVIECDSGDSNIDMTNMTDCDTSLGGADSISDIYDETICLCEEYRSVGHHVGEGFLLDHRVPLTDTFQDYVKLLAEAENRAGVEAGAEFLIQWNRRFKFTYALAHHDDHNLGYPSRIWRKTCRSILVMKDRMVELAQRFD